MPNLLLRAHNRTQIGPDKIIEVAVQHRFGIAGLIVCAVVLDHFIGMQDIAANLIANQR